MSPSVYWNLVLIILSVFSGVFIFVFHPILYFSIVRKLDKKFELKNYTIEKGTWFIGAGIRLVSYTLGIILQPYRNKENIHPFLKEITRRRFIYQDGVYGKPVNLRQGLSKLHLFYSYLYWIGVAIFLLFIILFMFHDFMLYPEFAAIRNQ